MKDTEAQQIKVYAPEQLTGGSAGMAPKIRSIVDVTKIIYTVSSFGRTIDSSMSTVPHCS